MGNGAGAGEALLAAAVALSPRIREAADQIERDRALPGWLVDALYSAGLFSMLVPASYGGAELALPSYVRVIETLGRADASVAWCVGQASGLTTNAAYMQPGVARDVFSLPTSRRRGILANGPGEGNRPGTATRTDGGYRVSGRWNFASGIRHASWLLAICRLHAPHGEPILHAGDPTEYTPGGEGLFGRERPAERLLLVPVEQAELIDTWQVSGLRGTGSFSFSLSDVFVSEDRCIHVSASTRCESGPLYQFASSGVFGPSFGGLALGVAGAALDAFVEFAGGKTPRGARSGLRDSPTVQDRVARVHARLGAARAYLYQTLDEVWSGLLLTGRLEVGARVAQRLAATHATHQALKVVDEAYAMAGSHAIFTQQPFERRFRDIHAISQQLQARAAHYETAGRHLLGLDPQSPFL